MALTFQNIDIPLSSGLDTKSDELQTQGALVLENCVFDEVGNIKKRDGYEELSRTVVDVADPTEVVSPTLVSANTLFRVNDRIGLFGNITHTGSKWYSGPGILQWSEQNQQWVYTTHYQAVEFAVEPKTAPKKSFMHPTLASGSNLVLLAYDDFKWDFASQGLFESANTTYFDIYDQNGTIIVNRQLFTESDGYGCPKALHLQDINGDSYFHVYAHCDEDNSGTSASIEYYVYDITNKSLGSLSTITSNSATQHRPLFDVDKISYDGYDEAIVAFRNSLGNLIVSSINADGSAHRTTTITGVDINQYLAVKVVNRGGSYGTRIFVVWADDSNTLTGAVLDQTLIEISKNNSVAAGVFLEYNNLGFEWDDTNSVFYVFKSGNQAVSNTDITIVTKMDWDGLADTTTPAGNTFSNQGLISKPWYFDGNINWISSMVDGYQNTYFLSSLKVNENIPTPLPTQITNAVILKNRATQKAEKSLSQVVLDGYTASVALMRAERQDSDGYFEQNVCIVDIEQKPIDGLPSVYAGKSTLVGGGVVRNIDILSTELGWLFIPKLFSLGASTSPLGHLGSGLYKFKLVVEYLDSNGNLHRSTPSNTFEHTVTESTNNILIEVIGTAYEYSDEWSKKTYSSSSKGAKMVLYRTLSNGLIFYRDQEVDLEYLSSANFFCYTDDRLDTHEPLYTEGELPNTAPPASKILISFNNVVYLVPMDNPSEIWYSKPYVQGIATEFNEILKVEVPTQEITGLGVLFGNIIAFSQREMFVLSGQPLDALGAGQGFVVQKLQTDVGAVNHKSIVSTEQGLVFKAEKGIYLLNRAMEVVYIGSAVEDFNDLRIKSALMLPKTTQVMFVTDSSKWFHWNYLQNKWAIFTGNGNNAVDACIDSDGNLNWLTVDGRVRRVTPGVYLDGADAITMKVKTPWLKLAGINGYQRIREFALLGEFESHCNIVIKVYTNFSNTAKQTITFDTSLIPTLTTGQPLRLTSLLNAYVQKCQSIAFEIYDTNQSGTKESVKLSVLSLDVGIKSGLVKLPEDQSY